MTQQNQTTYRMSIIQEEQISTKEIFQKIFGVFRLLFKSWKLILIFSALFSLLSIAFDYSQYQETQYGAEIVFNLELGGGGGGGGMGDLAGLAGAFGFGGGGNRTGEFFSAENFTQILNSKTVYEKALMKEITIGGKKTLFINYYKDSSDIAKKEWGGDLFNDPDFESINYKFTKKTPEQFTKKENEMIFTIYEKLSGNTEIRSLSKGSSMTSLVAITNNEMLSKIWLETLLKTMEEFYREVKTKKTRLVLDIQEKRLDSLRRVMLGTDRQLATLTAQNQNVVDPSGPLRQQQLSRNNSFTSNQYYQQLATVENLNLMMINQTPIFTVLEPVRLPLLKYQWYIGQRTTLGAIIGIVVGCLFIIIRRFFQELAS